MRVDVDVAIKRHCRGTYTLALTTLAVVPPPEKGLRTVDKARGKALLSVAKTPPSQEGPPTRQGEGVEQKLKSFDYVSVTIDLRSALILNNLLSPSPERACVDRGTCQYMLFPILGSRSIFRETKKTGYVRRRATYYVNQRASL